MLRKILCGLIVVGIVVSAHRASAQNWYPAPSSKQEEYRQAREALLENPADEGAMTRFANAATRIGNYEAAISTLERILLLRPDLERVRLELGVLYFRIRAYQMATLYLEEALKSGTLSPEDRERAQSFLQQIRRTGSNSRLTGSFAIGGRYQTNANAGLDTPTLRDAGFDVPAPGGRDEEDDFNVFLQFQVFHLYDLGTIRKDLWETRAFAYLPQQLDVEQANIAVAEVNTGPRFQIFPSRIDYLSLRPFVTGGISGIDYEFGNALGGGGIEVAKGYGISSVASLVYDARFREFEADNDEQSGTIQRISASTLTAWTEDIATILAGYAADENAEAEFRSNQEWSVWGRALMEYDAPFGLTRWPWEISGLARWTETDFDEPNERVDPFRSRRDDEIQLLLNQQVGVTRNLRLFFEAEYREVGSNLPNNELDNTSLTFGTSYRF